MPSTPGRGRYSLPDHRRRPGRRRAIPAQRSPLGRRTRRAVDRRFRSGQFPRGVYPRRVEGKTIELHHHQRHASDRPRPNGRRVLLAAFVNAGAIVRRLVDRQHVHILCAGTDGKLGEDDVLLAGMLVERLEREGGIVYRQNAQAMTARETWLHAFPFHRPSGPSARSRPAGVATCDTALAARISCRSAWKKTSSRRPGSAA